MRNDEEEKFMIIKSLIRAMYCATLEALAGSVFV